MRTSNYPAFGGRVIFKTRHLSILAAEWIDRALAQPHDGLAEGAYRNLVYALGLTSDLEFQFRGDENPMLEEMREFWQEYQRTPEEHRLTLAIQWRKETAPAVMDEWIVAVNAGTLPFRDPVKLPGHALTPEEQEQARDSNHPLAPSGATIASAAAPAPGTLLTR